MELRPKLPHFSARPMYISILTAMLAVGMALCLPQNSQAEPLQAKPAIKLLINTAKCAATFTAAHEIANQMANYSNVEALDRARRNWMALLHSLSLIAFADNGEENRLIIQNLLHEAYQKQYQKLVSSFDGQPANTFSAIQNRCKSVSKEIRNGISR